MHYFTDKLPENLLWFYLALSLFTFIVYAIDKYKARKGYWRTPERTLHVLALLGGWPGAALAQQLFRHKSKKREFMRVYWFTLGVSCCGLAWLVMHDFQLALLF